LLAATRYHGNVDRKHELGNIASTDISRCCWNIATYRYTWKVHNGKIEIISHIVLSAVKCRLQSYRIMHLAHSKLEIKNNTDAARSKLQLESDIEVQLKMKLYDMRDDFNFPIVTLTPTGKT
jgi:hypothetical protein